MNRLQAKVVCYFAYFDASVLLGVTKKINQTVTALNQMGYQTESVIVSERGLRAHWKMFASLFTVKADILLLRNTLYSMPLLAIAMAWQRLKGARIIIEVPTPNTVVMDEIRMMRDKGWMGRLIRLAMMMIALPWSLWPAHKIIQYAHESAYFSFGVRRKTQLMANGIDVASIPLRKTVPAWPAAEFIMIGVGSLAPWHAYDRVVRGIANYRELHPDSDLIPKLIVVGDGGVRLEWEKLSHELGVTDYVEFVGYRSGAELDALFEHAHVALASLGLFRKGLEMASDLKSREYTARGIPFVAAGYDQDFDPVPEFVFKVANEDGLINIEELYSWYVNLRNYADCHGQIRQFATKHLDIASKAHSLVL